ncbi:MAG: TPM domain-containing protein [Limnothrix sp. RL_2_0]|nr:TPM domain-containing protein [Limnothrix sp. RL_2_0]
MTHLIPRKLLRSFFAVCLAFMAWAIATPAFATNNPELLPDFQTPVVDLANFLPQLQEENLVKHIEEFESETGWKMRVLTQFDRSPGRAVKEYWGLDEKSVLLVADGRGGNLLAFSIGDDVYELMPRNFWIELQTRFGNMYYVRDHGENKAIADALETAEICLVREGGCMVVPGLPREQWILTLISSVLGGVICGFAAIPRKEGQAFAWQWALIMSPLWGILFLAFGVGPVVTRTSEWLPLFRNVMGFLMGAIVAFIAPSFNQPSPSESES